jgi:two-component system, LytTR family, response regulator
VIDSAKYRALIADDERIARVGLRAMLARYSQLRVVGEARDGEEAVEAIRDLQPDVVFLETQMPGRDGFGVMRELAAGGRPPAYVFVTANATRALEAFEADAVDYLHKPVTDARLRRTIQRVVRHLGAATAASPPPGADRMLLHTVDGSVFVDVIDVRRVSVEGNYLRVFTGTAEHVIRRTMAELAHALRGAAFVRISRSDLVNCARIRIIHRRQGGRYEVVLDGGHSVMSSRRYHRDVRAAIANWGAGGSTGIVERGKSSSEGASAIRLLQRHWG